MKKLILLFTLPLFLAFNSCKKEETAQFMMEYETTFAIPAGLPHHSVYSDTIQIQTDIAKYLSDNNTSADKIESTTPAYIHFVSTNDSVSIDHLKNVYLYMSADGLDEILVGWQLGPFISGDVKIEYMRKGGSDYTPYLTKNNVHFRLQTEVKTSAPENFGIKVKAAFIAKGVQN